MLMRSSMDTPEIRQRPADPPVDWAAGGRRESIVLNAGA
jgi:hypothetical protein